MKYVDVLMIFDQRTYPSKNYTRKIGTKSSIKIQSSFVKFISFVYFIRTYLISITLANMPAATAPCVVVAKVRKIKATVELHPEYANAMIKSP